MDPDFVRHVAIHDGLALLGAVAVGLVIGFALFASFNYFVLA